MINVRPGNMEICAINNALQVVKVTYVIKKQETVLKDVLLTQLSVINVTFVLQVGMGLTVTYLVLLVVIIGNVKGLMVNVHTDA